MIILIYMFIINCDIFVNKELENFLKEKKKNEKPEENSLREGLSRILSSSKLGDINPSTVSDTAYKQKISSSVVQMEIKEKMIQISKQLKLKIKTLH